MASLTETKTVQTDMVLSVRALTPGDHHTYMTDDSNPNIIFHLISLESAEDIDFEEVISPAPPRMKWIDSHVTMDDIETEDQYRVEVKWGDYTVELDTGYLDDKWVGVYTIVRNNKPIARLVDETHTYQIGDCGYDIKVKSGDLYILNKGDVASLVIIQDLSN